MLMRVVFKKEKVASWPAICSKSIKCCVVDVYVYSKCQVAAGITPLQKVENPVPQPGYQVARGLLQLQSPLGTEAALRALDFRRAVGSFKGGLCP